MVNTCVQTEIKLMGMFGNLRGDELRVLGNLFFFMIQNSPNLGEHKKNVLEENFGGSK